MILWGLIRDNEIMAWHWTGYTQFSILMTIQLSDPYVRDQTKHIYTDPLY